MVTTFFNRSFFLFALLLSIAFGFTSCSGSNKVDTNLSMAAPKPAPVVINPADAHFLVKAAEINLHEIMLAKLAQRRTGNEELRAMARMFEESHRSAKSSLAAIAIKKSVPIPSDATPLVEMAYDTLNARDVYAFDQKYCEMMIESHRNAISYFETYTASGSDSDISLWATTLLPELRMHLSKAQEVEAHLNPISELIR